MQIERDYKYKILNRFQKQYHKKTVKYLITNFYIYY